MRHPTTVVVINQPSFFPWAGEFQKLALADTSVCLDHVDYQKAGFLTRARISRGETGWRWLSVPTSKATRHGSIQSVRVCPDRAWVKRLHAVAWESFRGQRYADEAMDLLDAVLNQPFDSAVDLAEDSIARSADFFNVQLPPRLRSSSLSSRTRKSHLVLDLVREVGGSEYVYGPGSGNANSYLDDELLSRNGIVARRTKYPDHANAATPPPLRLSCLDLAARYGSAALRIWESGRCV